MNPFSSHTGSWHGVNEFRLMPADAPHSAPVSATVTLAAGGNLATIEYSWVHPDDGRQEGLLVIGMGEGPTAALAFWADSWHQHPSPQTLKGSFDSAVCTLEYEYAKGWRWRITVDLSGEGALVLRMDNIVPESAGTEEFAGGAYPAMLASLTRDAA